MRILVLDNYDSFTYNLVQILDKLGLRSATHVIRNDKISLEEVNGYDKIMLSPGPGVPRDAGIMPDLLKEYASQKSILGVCLGHQAIAEHYGAELFNMPVVLHGIPSDVIVRTREDRLFRGLPERFRICHYHSWSVAPVSVKSNLEVTALDNDGQVMAIRSVKDDVHGVQFHPESILTEHGIKMIKNWLDEGK